MATTKQEAEAVERKLRPVYDAVDNGQNKKAVQLVDKILKKSPGIHCAKALKALALLRMGRMEESKALVDGVIETRPGDSATLQAVVMYCRELGDYNKIVDLYESAAKNYHGNEEILTHLFMSYVRIGDYQKQQQTAVQLLKHFPQNGPYYCWRVMSVVMQAHESSDPNRVQSMYLPLAEKLMEKYITDKRVEAEAEIRLYILILEYLGKKDKILELLNGKLGAKLRNPDELLTNTLDCLKSLQRWDEIVKKLHPLIPKDPDNWNYLKLFITAQVSRSVVLKGNPLNEDQDSTKSVDGLSPVYETKQLIDQLIATECQRSRFNRGPFLAQLELLLQLNQNDIKIQDDGFTAVSVVLLDYFKRFSSKGCCYDDMRTYLSLLNTQEQVELSQRAEEFVKENPINYECEEGDTTQNIQNVYRHISLLRLQRCCGLHLSLTIAEKKSLIVECQKWFEDGLVFGLTLPSTVNQHSDFYILLAAHLMIEIYAETGEYRYLWDCAVMLESAQKQSCTNPQIQLLLIRIYGYLGPVELCTQLYNSLSIKHIQMDTLGYLTNRYIQAMGAFGFSGQLFRIALRFYITCNKETSDYVTNAYKNGIFHKIIEMIDLRDRISQSYVFYSLGIDSLIQDFLHDANSMKQVREFLTGDKYRTSLPYTFNDLEGLCATFKDNRDLDVFDDWSPIDQKITKDEIRLSFELETFWIKLRLSIVQCLKDLVSMETTTTSDSAVVSMKKVRRLLEEAEKLEGIDYLRRKKCPLIPIQSPPPCQMELFLREKHGVLLQQTVDIVLKVLDTPGVCPSLEEYLLAAKDTLKGITEKIQGIPAGLQEAMKSDPNDDLWTATNNPFNFLLTQKIDLEQYVILIIVSSWIVVLCGVCVEKLTIGKREGKKRKGKSTGANPTSSHSDINNTNVSLLVDFLTDIKASILSVSTRFRPHLISDTQLVEKLSKLSISSVDTQQSKVKAELYGGVMESYNTSFRDCQDLVQILTTFINSIIQPLASPISTSKKIEQKTPDDPLNIHKN